MICFCDKKVYSIYQQEVDRAELFSFFIKKEHIDDVVVVYDDENNFLGIITYKTILYNKEDFIQKEKVKLLDNMWDEANEIFDKNKNIELLPLFNKKNELIYLCYRTNKGPLYDIIEEVLNIIEKEEEKVFIQDLYPNVEAVYIYDMNEWAYRLYKCLKKRRIPVVVHGQKWNQICEIENTNEEYPDFARLNIYAEGTDMVLDKRDKLYMHEKNYEIIREIGGANQLYTESLTKNNLSKIGKKMIICNIPELDGLEDYIPDELYRRKLSIYPSYMNKKSQIANEQFEKVAGMDYLTFKTLHEADEKIEKSIKGIDINNGKTIVGDKAGKGNNTIYIMAPICIANWLATLYKDRLGMKLLECMNKKYRKEYEIITITIFDIVNTKSILESLDITGKDIIIYIGTYSKEVLDKLNLTDHIDLDFTDILNKRSETQPLFYDMPIHLNDKGNELLAKTLYENFIETHIIENYDKVVDEKDYLTKAEKKELDKYLKSIQNKKFNIDSHNKVGSIVMNCNPFTKGHLYLIEKALENVDYLYIFVVEEDKSYFKFKDRLELVKLGTEKFENVSVIPSGEFILSYTTLKNYFEKEKNQDVIIDASNDINIFAKYIAPFMSINVRFVGEEPLDKITKQYNEEMERTLGKYGIEFIEIPRVQKDSEVISASRVRKLLKEGNFEDIKELVPVTTYNFLKNNFKIEDIE